jgi:hypothetical protein
MATHGGGYRTRRPMQRPAAKVGQFEFKAQPKLKGFQHFLGDPDNSFKIDGGRAPRSDMARLQKLMKLLSRRMTADGTAVGDNPRIPAGYTYLLQFVAHDVVATSPPFWALDDASRGVSNKRTSRLRLDTLYGAGPAVNPVPYAPDDAFDASRTKLRLGHTKPPIAGGCPFRDIARATVTDASGVLLKGPSEPLIADARNDDHVIISQLTVLFHALHNAIVDLLAAANRDANRDDLAHKRFACARNATTLIYRKIIRNDLLPKILHQAVAEHYDVKAPPFIDTEFSKNPSGPLPLEFSHGAFRFGHAMVRSQYQINGRRSQYVSELMRQSSSRNSAEMPLDKTWLVSWSRFFELGGPDPVNFSRLLSPTIAQPLMSTFLFGPIDDSDWFGLPYRDLMSAVLADLWSVGALVGKVAAQKPKLMEGAYAKDPNVWRADLQKWLAGEAISTELEPEDAQTLAADPPLPFFVLFEAERETGGQTLGRLGSIIVAEVLYALLEEEPLAVGSGFNLATELDAVAGSYGKGIFDIVSNIKTMPALIQFIAGREEWRQAQPPLM